MSTAYAPTFERNYLGQKPLNLPSGLGGVRLSGLGQTDDFPAGSLATLGITSTQTTLQSAASVMAAVASILGNQGITVVSMGTPQMSLDFFNQVANEVAPVIAPFSVSMTVSADSDYGEAADVQSIVNNAFYQVTGQMPAASQVTSVAPPGTAPPPVAVGSPSASSVESDVLEALPWIAVGLVAVLVVKEFL